MLVNATQISLMAGYILTIKMCCISEVTWKITEHVFSSHH